MSTEQNARFYGELRPGVSDYWKWMAAPRFRLRTVIGILEKERPSSVIDLGCGGGELLWEIKKRLGEVQLAGIDLSRELVEQNSRRMPWARFWVADLGKRWDEAPTTGFDAVLALEVIEHIESPEIFLRNAWDLGKRGTLLVLTTQSGKVHETERRVGHVRHYAQSEMRELLAATGWRAERIWNAGFPFHDLSKWIANLDPDRAMERFGTRPYGAIEKGVAILLQGLFRLNSNRRGAQLFVLARR
ncbi:MAG: class I SAM-dependent methyltransferase [Deltaproteobacteria bacterium]|nr:class I SAM-dependent methyltransferase [Deltaproteobacteria bacterium]